MALQKTFPNNANLATYIRVEMVLLGKSQPVQIQTAGFVLDQTSGALVPVSGGQNFVVSQNTPGYDLFSLAALEAAGNNPYKAAYNWLRTYVGLFQDFTDILEA